MQGFEQVEVDVLQDGQREVEELVWLDCCVHHVFFAGYQ